MNNRSIFLLCGLALLAHIVMAQDTTVVSLPTMTIQSTRQLETETTAARSLYIRQHSIIASEPGLSLQRVLRGLPGLQISERGHFALGEPHPCTGNGLSRGIWRPWPASFPGRYPVDDARRAKYARCS